MSVHKQQVHRQKKSDRHLANNEAEGEKERVCQHCNKATRRGLSAHCGVLHHRWRCNKLV